MTRVDAPATKDLPASYLALHIQLSWFTHSPPNITAPTVHMLIYRSLWVLAVVSAVAALLPDAGLRDDQKATLSSTSSPSMAVLTLRSVSPSSSEAVLTVLPTHPSTLLSTTYPTLLATASGVLPGTSQTTGNAAQTSRAPSASAASSSPILSSGAIGALIAGAIGFLVIFAALAIWHFKYRRLLRKMLAGTTTQVEMEAQKPVEERHKLGLPI